MGAEHDHDVATGVPGLSVEVLFCSTARGVAQLDCRAVSGPGAGWPFVMRLGLPAHAPWSAAAERMLARWAEQSAVVTVEVRAGRRPTKVRLSDGVAALLLDATAAGSVIR